MQPLQGWSNDGCHPGALPPSIEFIPFGEKSKTGFGGIDNPATFVA